MTSCARTHSSDIIAKATSLPPKLLPKQPHIWTCRLPTIRGTLPFRLHASPVAADLELISYFLCLNAVNGHYAIGMDGSDALTSADRQRLLPDCRHGIINHLLRRVYIDPMSLRSLR